jgi:hypothetical protein
MILITLQIQNHYDIYIIKSKQLTMVINVRAHSDSIIMMMAAGAVVIVLLMFGFNFTVDAIDRIL